MASVLSSHPLSFLPLLVVSSSSSAPLLLPSPLPLKVNGHYLYDEHPRVCTHMEGSDEECHRTGTSCEGGESQRGVDILKVLLCGLVPVQRECVSVSV